MHLGFHWAATTALAAMIKYIIDLQEWGEEVEEHETYVVSAMIYAQRLEYLIPHWQQELQRLDDDLENERFFNRLFKRDFYDEEASFNELLAMELILKLHHAINRRFPKLWETGTYFTSIAWGHSEEAAVIDSKSQIVGMPKELLTV